MAGIVLLSVLSVRSGVSISKKSLIGMTVFSHFRSDWWLRRCGSIHQSLQVVDFAKVLQEELYGNLTNALYQASCQTLDQSSLLQLSLATWQVQSGWVTTSPRAPRDASTLWPSACHSTLLHAVWTPCLEFWVLHRGSHSSPDTATLSVAAPQSMVRAKPR